MIESSRLCAAEKLLLVKILFKEVSFNASFESPKGRDGMDGKRNEENFRLTVQQRSASKEATTMLWSIIQLRNNDTNSVGYNGESKT